MTGSRDMSTRDMQSDRAKQKKGSKEMQKVSNQKRKGVRKWRKLQKGTPKDRAAS